MITITKPRPYGGLFVSDTEFASTEKLVAIELASALKRNKVPYVFGMPGGGSSIDLIEACRAEKIPFILAQHETTAAIMAIVCGELSDSCGVCISIMGTGAINLAGGATYAYLERHPLICITETYDPMVSSLMSLQKIDHGATFAPYCKSTVRLDVVNPGEQIDQSIKLAMSERPGPIHGDYPQRMSNNPQGHSLEKVTKPMPPPNGDLDFIIDKIYQAEKPIIIAGPVVLRQDAKNNLLCLVDKLQCGVMVTSKARGVITENHPLYAGVISGVYHKDTIEGRMMEKADVVLAIGLDRMELLTPWKHKQPLLSLDAIAVPEEETVGKPLQAVWGHLPTLIDSITNSIRQCQKWKPSEIRSFWDRAMDELGAGSTILNAANVLVHARNMSPHDTILTTEAGVYGRVGLYAWQVYQGDTYFDSSGANTMGYSVPAALATTLLRPNQKTVCLVGDAGFLMRAGELETAARLKVAPVIIIFDDRTLGMIRVKQQSKQYVRTGVDLEQTDFVRLTESFGGVGWKVKTLEQFDHAFSIALESDRLHVIDVRVDSEIYASHIKPIRGI